MINNDATYSGEDKKILPDTLSGTYTLYMHVGTTTYSWNFCNHGKW